MHGHRVAMALVVVIAASCGAADSESTAPTANAETTDAGSGAAVIDPGDGGEYDVTIDPAEFTSVVDHEFLPLRPGARWVYREATADGEVEVITVEVLDETRDVMGVETVVVHDEVATEDGDVVEDTYDWYAQDAAGNVWYFGEDTKAYDEDGTVSEAGAWEAGVDGALPGIVMPAAPEVSDTGYRQEFLGGEAEDMGQIIDRTNGVVVTRDWTPLEPGVVEEKTYVSGVGFVFEAKTGGEDAGATAVLVEFTAGR